MRLIDADALVSAINAINSTDYGSMFDYNAHMEVNKALRDVLRIACDAPTIEAEPVRHGEWVDGRCSKCGEDAPFTEKAEEVYDYDWEENLRYSHTNYTRKYIESPYCSACGAKMDGGAEDG